LYLNPAENQKTMENRITTLFGIRYPVVAGGMVWCSGWRVAAPPRAAGGAGGVGSGSMTPELLREHIRKCRAATSRPFGVNVPLAYRYAPQLMDVITEERVPAVFTSAGNPATWTARLHDAGCRVAHVVSSSKFALKSREAGVDAVVAEGFEAGGHNGREETTTMALVPQVRQAGDPPPRPSIGRAPLLHRLPLTLPRGGLPSGQKFTFIADKIAGTTPPCLSQKPSNIIANNLRFSREPLFERGSPPPSLRSGLFFWWITPSIYALH